MKGRKERVTTTLDLDLYNLATENNIPFSKALALGIQIAHEQKLEAYEILENRIDYLEDNLSKLSDIVNDFYSEYKRNNHDE